MMDGYKKFYSNFVFLLPVPHLRQFAYTKITLLQAFKISLIHDSF